MTLLGGGDDDDDDGSTLISLAESLLGGGNKNKKAATAAIFCQALLAVCWAEKSKTNIGSGGQRISVPFYKECLLPKSTAGFCLLTSRPPTVNIYCMI